MFDDFTIDDSITVIILHAGHLYVIVVRCNQSKTMLIFNTKFWHESYLTKI